MNPVELDQLVREIGEEVRRRLGNAALAVPACACSTPAPSRAQPNGHGARGANREPEGVASLINQTLLRPEATAEEIRCFCHEARHYGFASVLVPPAWVSIAVRELRGSGTRVGSVIGCRHGTTLTPVKLAEAEQVLKLGACEVEMAMHAGALNSGYLDEVYSEIRLATECVHAAGGTLTVLAEMALLVEEQKVTACALAKLAGADAVKTSSEPGGVAAVADVALARRVVGGELEIEAAGGIDSHARLLEMTAGGATRIGTSAGVAIVNQASHA